MTALPFPDETQRELCRHLVVTEELLARAATLASGGREQSASILPMPDLGLPDNVQRAHGGFFTGALYQWTCDQPFVPIDATVNVCSVSVFRVRRALESADEFSALVAKTKRRAEGSEYVWNWESGNHFLSIYDDEDSGEQCLVMHSSAAEFKGQPHGLYPSPGNWYAAGVKVLQSQSHPGRYLRYITGRLAEQFHTLATMLVDYNHERHRWFAETLLGPQALGEEVWHAPHYGMPDAQSVAVGCMWQSKPSRYLLLTAPGQPVFWIDPTPASTPNRVQLADGQSWVQPHGLGTKLKQVQPLRWNDGGLAVGDTVVPLSCGFSQTTLRSIRGADDAAAAATCALQTSPGHIVSGLRPRFCHSAALNLPAQAARHRQRVGAGIARPAVALVLIRHAPTSQGDEPRFLGASDAPCEAQALAQMRSHAGVTKLLGGARGVLVSPLQRCLATCAALLPEHPFTVDARLTERGLGEWEGMTKSSARIGHPLAFMPTGQLHPRFCPPGGESIFEFAQRVLAFLRLAWATGPVLAVTHHGVIRMAAYLVAGAEEDIATVFAKTIPHGCPSTLELTPQALWRAHTRAAALRKAQP